MTSLRAQMLSQIELQHLFLASILHISQTDWIVSLKSQHCMELHSGKIAQGLKQGPQNQQS